MRTIDDLKRWKKYGFILTPAAADKSPGLKPKQKWKFDWLSVRRFLVIIPITNRSITLEDSSA